MKASSQAARLILITLASLSFVSSVRSTEPLKLKLGFAKSVVVEGAAAGKFTSIIGDQKIADFTFGPKNIFWFIGKREGTTNVIVLDNATGKEMYSATIEVAPDETGTNRVEVHNKSLVTSYTVYRCNPGCSYVNEVTAAEPAPLPRGHLDSTSTIQSNTTLPGSRPLNSTTTIQSDTEFKQP